MTTTGDNKRHRNLKARPEDALGANGRGWMMMINRCVKSCLDGSVHFVVDEIHRLGNLGIGLLLMVADGN